MQLLLSLILVSTPSHAASFAAKWANPSVTLNINPWMAILYPDSVTAMNDVASDVHGNASNFYWATQYDDDVTTAVANGENETSLLANIQLYCGVNKDHCMAAVYDSTGKWLQETDVLLNSVTAWSYTDLRSTSYAYGGNYTPIKTGFLHELARAAGLNTNSAVYNLLGTDLSHMYVNGDNVYEYLGEDVTAGLRSGYGTYGGEDVGIVHWKYFTALGGYSVHSRTTITSSTGAALSTTTSGLETVYKITKGSSYRVEYTLENNGSNSQKPSLYFYLSSDNVISSADTYLGSTSVTVTPDTPFTTYTTVAIPAAQATGTWYLGVLADKANSIAELDENNNYTWTMVRVQ